jgi:hypothetical protein
LWAFFVQAFAPLAAGEGPIALFDGKSLAGWVTAEGQPVTKGWSVEDGALVRSGDGGSIYTDREYGDFDLSFEWRIAHRGNSGVKYRVAHFEKGIYGNPSWLGCEYQIYDDAARGPEPLFSSASIYALVEPVRDKSLRPVGEFNEARIVARGPRIEHWLNGSKVVDIDTNSADWKTRIAASKFSVVDGFFENPKGRIELQDHGHRVWFRNMVLTPLHADGH